MAPGMTHEEHLKQLEKDAELKKHGAMAMGFDQDKATHHFRLTDEGGAIEVHVTDASDTVTLEQVRAHLNEIAGAFARGVFEKPFATHGEVPPGVPMLKKRAAAIRYTYEPTTDGGRVVISSSDRKAVDAVHEFLRYQIREHRTGDPPAVQPPVRTRFD